jgi:hypothetical protein
LKVFFRKTFNKISFDVSVLLSENDKNINDSKTILKLENDLGIRRSSIADFKTSVKKFTSNYQTKNKV